MSVGDRVKSIRRATRWQAVATIPLHFDTGHPQGMVKIGNDLYVSSVEIRTPPERFAAPVGGYDRSAGEGVGHLFKFDAAGDALVDAVVGEGSTYHPGSIDYDGRRRSFAIPTTSAPSSTTPTTTRCTACPGARSVSTAGGSITAAR